MTIETKGGPVTICSSEDHSAVALRFLVCRRVQGALVAKDLCRENGRSAMETPPIEVLRPLRNADRAFETALLVFPGRTPSISMALARDKVIPS